MNKYIALVAVLLSCTFAHGDWLYWTLDFSDSKAGTNPLSTGDGTATIYLMSAGDVESEGDTLTAGKTIMGGSQPQYGEMLVDTTDLTYYFEMQNSASKAIYRSNSFGYDFFSAWVTSEMYDPSSVWNAAIGTTWTPDSCP